jgi:Anti-sigma factor NepR
LHIGVIVIIENNNLVLRGHVGTDWPVIGYAIDSQPHGIGRTNSATVRYNEILFGTMTLPTAFPHPTPQNGQSNDGLNTPPAMAADSDALTEALRQSFQATVEEAVPDSLMDLINQLK